MSSFTNLLVMSTFLATLVNVESIRFVKFSTVTDPVVTTVVETSTIELCVSLVAVTGGCRRKRDIIERQLIEASAVQQMETTRTARLNERANSKLGFPDLSSSFSSKDEVDHSTAKQLMNLKEQIKGRIYLKPVITFTESPGKTTVTTTSASNFYIISGCTPPILYHPTCQ